MQNLHHLWFCHVCALTVSCICPVWAGRDSNKTWCDQTECHQKDVCLLFLLVNVNPTSCATQCLCLWILRSPGFGLWLVAETTNGTFLSAELVSNHQGQGAAVLPEDLGRNCAKLLLEEIHRVCPLLLQVRERSHQEAVLCHFYSLATFFLF